MIAFALLSNKLLSVMKREILHLAGLMSVAEKEEPLKVAIYCDSPLYLSFPFKLRKQCLCIPIKGILATLSFAILQVSTAG